MSQIATVEQAMERVFAFEDGRRVRARGSMLCAADLGECLNLSNIRGTLALLPERMKGVYTVDTLGGPQQMAFVSEAGVYRLIFMSRKPEAERFQNWVCEEVLPAIRDGTLATRGGPDPVLLEMRDLQLQNRKALEIVRAEVNARLDVMEAQHAAQDQAHVSQASAHSELLDRSDKILRIADSKIRKDPAETNQRDYRRVILGPPYRGMCPVCGEVRIVNDDLSATKECEVEHWVRNTVFDRKSCWLTCKKCNHELGPAGHWNREKYRSAFGEFQRHLEDLKPERSVKPAPSVYESSARGQDKRTLDMFGGQRWERPPPKPKP